MAQRTMAVRTLAVALSLLAIIMTAPFSPAETLASSPLGNVVVPADTKISAGSDSPSPANLKEGSRIEMTKASATLEQQGSLLVVQFNRGLIGFTLVKGENVQIKSGKYTFSFANDSAHVGELSLNRDGLVVMTVTEGVVTALNTVTGVRSEASPDHPVVLLDQSGKGIIKMNGKTLTDNSKSLRANLLKGRCAVAEGEVHKIVSNTAKVFKSKNAWKLNTGSYDYNVVDCTKDVLIAAGATPEAADEATMEHVSSGRGWGLETSTIIELSVIGVFIGSISYILHSMKKN
jgi:hypothetical protein